MALIVSKSTSNFKKVSPGPHVARCVRVVDMGTSLDERFGKTKRKVSLSFEIGDEFVEVEGVQKPMMLSKDYTYNLGDKSNLRHDLEGWRSKPFSDIELEGFDLANVLDKPCMITVVHKQTGADSFANISAISPLYNGVTCPPRVHDLLLYEVANGEDAIFNQLPEWQRLRIKKCNEFNPTQRLSDDSEHLGEFIPVESDEVPF